MAADKKGIMKIKAIALGVITDLIGSLILSIPIGVIGTVIHLSRGGKPETFKAFLHSNIPLLLFSLIIGLALVIVGGVVTAYIAKEKRVWNAFLTGVVISLVGIPFSLSLPFWFSALSFVLTIPSATFGGWIVQKRQRGQQSPPPLPRAPAGHSEGEG